MRTAPPIPVPIAIYPLQVTPPLLVFSTNAVSVLTGDIVINSAPTTPVEFVIPLGTSLMTVQLNIFPPLSCLQSLEDPSSVTARGLVTEPGAQMYKGGNVTILFPHRSTLLIVHSRRLLTWRGRGNALCSNTSYFLVHSLSTSHWLTFPQTFLSPKLPLS